jgi:Domain of unknown function (DUF4338)
MSHGQPPAPALKEPLVVRLLRCEERGRWRQLMNQHHYLGIQRLVGQSLCYVATVGEPWVALLAWGAAALKCQPRDAWIGWAPSLKWRRLHLIANNLRFLILPDWHRPNLASRILALNLKRLSADWERYYGHPILVAETFVDSARFQGTCYRAAGWQMLGTTRGFAKRGRGYIPHGQPKLVLVRPLTAEAVAQLVTCPTQILSKVDKGLNSKRSCGTVCHAIRNHLTCWVDSLRSHMGLDPISG